MAPFLLSIQDENVQPSLNLESAYGSILPWYQFGPGLLDPEGFKMMAAIAARTVTWVEGLGAEDSGEYLSLVYIQGRILHILTYKPGNT